MARRKKIASGVEEVNLTPMIDCTFQLIIFFIISAQMTTEAAKLLPPKPSNSLALKATQGQAGKKNAKPGGGKVIKERITVNLFSEMKDDKKRSKAALSAGNAKDPSKVVGCVVAYGAKKELPFFVKPPSGTKVSYAGLINWASDPNDESSFKGKLAAQIKAGVEAFAKKNPDYNGDIELAKKNIFIEFRADKDLHYYEIEPFLVFCSKQGFQNMAISAAVDKTKGKKK